MMVKSSVRAPRSSNGKSNGTDDAPRELVAQAYERLRRLIVMGELAPGTRIIAVDIAQRLGISRTPIRSALHILVQEGYIHAAGEGRQSRLTIAPLTREDAFEVFSIVGEIEGLAARWAAELDRAPRQALVQRLKQVNAAMARAASDAPRNSAETSRLDGEFHNAYVEAAAGPRLLALHRAFKPQADRYIQLYYTTLTTEVMTSTQEHSIIIDAIARGDATGARTAVQNNWENAARRLHKSIAQFGERGIW
jgi:DNA-binding GntR family transcriptional regulator